LIWPLVIPGGMTGDLIITGDHMRKTVKRLFTVLLAICMLLGSGILQAAAEETGKVLNSETPSLQSPSNQNSDNWGIHEDGTVHILVMLDAPSVLAEFEDAQSADAVAYEEQLLTSQQDLLAQIQRKVGPRTTVSAVWNMTLACNAVSISIPSDYLGLHTSVFSMIEGLSGVRDVLPVPMYKYNVNSAASSSNGTDLNGTGSYSGNSSYSGAGMKIAFIDSGMDVNHISFDGEAYLYAVDPEGTRPERASQIDEETLNKLCVKRRFPELSAEEIYVSEKIPFIFNYQTGAPDVSYPLTELGATTSVAGAAAGNRYVKFGDDIVDAMSSGSPVGIAPDAQIFAFDVVNRCAVYGTGVGNWYYWDDVMAALEDAVRMECNVINLGVDVKEIGYTFYHYYAPGEFNPYAQEMLSCIADNTDIVVNVCAGNTGSGILENTRLDSTPSERITQPGTSVDSLCVAAANGSGSTGAGSEEMAEYSSWGVSGSLVMKPEIVAPGNVFTAYAGGALGERDDIEWMEGAGIAAGEMAGATALVGDYLNHHAITQSLSRRAAMQSLLMSTAAPLMKDGKYYPILQQGSGLMDLDAALNAKTLLVMNSEDETLTAITGAAADGKVKAELGDDPDRTGNYSYSFRIYNISDETVFFDSPYTDAFTQDYYYKYDSEGNLESGPYMAKETTGAQRTVDYTWTPSETLPVTENPYDINGDGITNDRDAQALLNYLAGNLQAADVSLDAADLDGDGIITSHDAELLLDYAENHPSNYVPRGGYADVTVRFRFDADNDVYTAGAFIEGYTYLTEKSGVTHSVPILGYYGDWTEPNVLEYEDFQPITLTQEDPLFNGSGDLSAMAGKMQSGVIDRLKSFFINTVFKTNRSVSQTGAVVFKLDEPGGTEQYWLQGVPYYARSSFSMVNFPSWIPMEGTEATPTNDTPLRYVFFAIPEYTALKYNYEHGIRDERTGEYSAELSAGAIYDFLASSDFLNSGAVHKFDLTREDWYSYVNEASDHVEPEVIEPLIVPELTDANIDLVQSVASANGITEVTYDPDQVVFKGITSGLNYTAVHVDEENGVIRFVFADTEELDEGTLLANIHLGIRACCHPEATVTVRERGEEYGLSETTTVDLPDTHSWVYTNAKWLPFNNSYKVYAQFHCDECGEECQKPMEIVSIEQDSFKRTVYTAVLRAENSPDGEEHTATRTGKPAVVRPWGGSLPIIGPIRGIIKP